MRVAACLVTRGNVPMDDIIESIPDDWEVVLWDNSKRENLGVYGRFAAIELTEAEMIYVQDDDCVLEPVAFETLSNHSMTWPKIIQTNMPERFRPHYPDSCLIGFGAMFHRSLPKKAFDRLGPELPRFFDLACDVYFTALTEHFSLDLPYRDQPWASDDDRMWKRKNHVGERNEALRAARTFR